MENPPPGQERVLVHRPDRHDERCLASGRFRGNDLAQHLLRQIEPNAFHPAADDAHLHRSAFAQGMWWDGKIFRHF